MTVPVVCSGIELQLSADVGRNGYVKVSLYDENNKRLAESERIRQTVTDGKVKWRERFSIGALQGKDVSLRLELKGAKLYSFGFDLIGIPTYAKPFTAVRSSPATAGL